MGVNRFNKLGLNLFALLYSFVAAQEYFEELHKTHYTTYLKQIPKNIELKGSDASDRFVQQFHEIQNLAKKDNLTVIFKIKVVTLKPYQMMTKKMLYNKGKSKKFNIPLKKNSMKLSNFEMFLRKMAEENGRNLQMMELNQALTTEKQLMMTTKIAQMKYKPIISRVKTNYTKRIKPVRIKEIVLT